MLKLNCAGCCQGMKDYMTESHPSLQEVRRRVGSRIQHRNFKGLFPELGTISFKFQSSHTQLVPRNYVVPREHSKS